VSEGAAKPGRPALLVNTVELMRVAGSRKHVSDIATAGDLGAEHAAIAGAIAVEVDLESTVDDIGLHGTIVVPRVAHCRRCLKPIADTVTIVVDERYAEPAADAAAGAALAERCPSETFPEPYPMRRGQIDLRPMVREEVLLALDEAPLCRLDCPGLCPVCGRDVSVEPCECDATVVDDRWAVLDQLRDR